jgi:hypothetical protein
MGGDEALFLQTRLLQIFRLGLGASGGCGCMTLLMSLLMALYM